MNNIEPTYSYDEVIELLGDLADANDRVGMKMLAELIVEEKRYYCIEDLMIFKLLFTFVN